MKYYSKNTKILKEKNITFFLKKNKIHNIVLCHGVFDIVHPGHIRHLTYCKSISDILIVSITGDKFIRKGLYRPLVPENIRAFNLAALSCVDYVVINNDFTPIKLIKKIKPKFYAKGSEYKKLNSKTIEEKKIIEKYKGKIIFTPGDYILSSSKIINESNPKISLEKLKYLMDAENINFDKLRSIIKQKTNVKVTIIGDTIVDLKSRCQISSSSSHKTPALSIVENNCHMNAGGAAIVAKHFSALTSKVNLISVIGDDNNGKFIKKDLDKNRISYKFFSEQNRPTITKKSYWANNHNLLKVSTVNNNSINQETLEKITKEIKKNDESDIFVISDFRHGIFNDYNNKYIIDSINKNKFRVADSQIASRWGNILEFKNFDLITPTENEARIALHKQDMPIRPLSDELMKVAKARNLILKLGENGLISLNQKRKDYIVLDSFVKNLVDGKGSGDTLLAYSSLFLFLTKSLIISSIIGSIAASCQCEIDGNEKISKEKILNKIDEIESQTFI